VKNQTTNKPTEQIIAELRKQIARFSGSASRLCGILNVTPTDPIDDSLLDALAAWMNDQERKPTPAAKPARKKPTWEF
jgi:hypothetical protein